MLQCLLPSRSVIVVATPLVLAQSSWAKPLGEYLNTSLAPGFDWGHPSHTAARCSALLHADTGQGKPGVTAIQTGGGDASSYDRTVTGQCHAIETAWYLDLFPKEATLIIADQIAPIYEGDELVARAERELRPGESKRYDVTYLNKEGRGFVGHATLHAVHVDYHKFICNVMSAINSADVAVGGLVVRGQTTTHDVPNYLGRRDEPLTIESRGGRSSGDRLTGVANNFSNGWMMHAAAYMSRDPEQYGNLMNRRTSRFGEKTPPPTEIVDELYRGDDSLLALKLPRGG
jgi:hypothetical protein